MVTKLLCLSIWMSVSAYAMEEGQPELHSIDVTKKDKMPTLSTTRNDKHNAERIRFEAFKDGLIAGRKEGEELIKKLTNEQTLLMQLLSLKSETNNILSVDLKQSREQYEMLQTNLRNVAQRFHDIIIKNKSFRSNPAGQIILLQEAFKELEELAL